MEARDFIKENSHRTIADKGYTAALVRKWGQLLEGISSPHTKAVTAVLMENESQWLQSLDEDTTTINVGSFTKFIFPVLRRVFPNLIANEIVSVQPMTSPVGAVFYYEYKYDSNKGATTAGSIFPLNFDRNYSSEYIDGEVIGQGDGSSYTSGTTGNAILAWTPVRALDTTLGYSVTVIDYNPTTQVNVQTLVDNGTGSLTGNGTATINYGNGNLTAISFSVAPAVGDQIIVQYWYNGELNTKIPQVRLDLSKTPIEAIPRRLKALWSSEAAEDLRAFHGLDAETELVSGIAQEIALEIDREVINDLYVNSTGNTGTFSVTPPAGINELDQLRSMITQISILSNRIHKNTLRAPANFIVTSPDVSARLTQLTTHGDFRPLWVSGGASPYGPADMPRPLTQHGQFGIYKVGTLMNKWVVYEDPFFANTDPTGTSHMLVGLKGANFLDAGYVWAPYIPLQVTPSFLDPADFSFRKGLRTRYGKAVLRNTYYANLKVTGL
jgi:hypothetical protein